MFENVYDFRLQQKRHEGAIAAQDKDYSRYKFRFDAGALKAQDTELILILVSVAQTIPCDEIKEQITEIIGYGKLKEWLLIDILVECDETFFSKEEKFQAYENILNIDLKDLEIAFMQIVNQINY